VVAEVGERVRRDEHRRVGDETRAAVGSPVRILTAADPESRLALSKPVDGGLPPATSKK
jgi:hypothetical protein